ncbi:MAG: hypothetical protein AB7P13_15070 [Candidatus Nitrosocosmicus sp.]
MGDNKGPDYYRNKKSLAMVTIYDLNSTGVRPIKLEVQITRISFYIIED